MYSDVNKELYNIKTEADVLIKRINTNITFNWLKTNFYDNFYKSDETQTIENILINMKQC